MPSNYQLHRSVPHITREEIRLTIQLHLMALYRRHFLLQELENMNSNTNHPPSRLVYDIIQISECINAKLRSHRSHITNHAHYIDDKLYRHAATIEEYSNLDDLGDRVLVLLTRQAS